MVAGGSAGGPSLEAGDDGVDDDSGRDGDALLSVEAGGLLDSDAAGAAAGIVDRACGSVKACWRVIGGIDGFMG